MRRGPPPAAYAAHKLYRFPASVAESCHSALSWPGPVPLDWTRRMGLRQEQSRF